MSVVYQSSKWCTCAKNLKKVTNFILVISPILLLWPINAMRSKISFESWPNTLVKTSFDNFANWFDFKNKPHLAMNPCTLTSLRQVFITILGTISLTRGEFLWGTKWITGKWSVFELVRWFYLEPWYVIYTSDHNQ